MRAGKLPSALERCGIQVNSANPNPWDISVKDVDSFTHRLASPWKNGLTELGDLYVEGAWDCAEPCEFLRRCLAEGLNERFCYTVPNLRKFLRARFFNIQTKPRASKDVSSHYNLGPVFEVMLDPTMTYTCGYWTDGVRTLEESQLAKHGLACRKLGLQPGFRVLDIGCGWGGFLKFAAENHPIAEGIGITLSSDQATLGMKRCEGLPVKLLVRDYRDVEGEFDRIASFGMFEHVGPKNYRTFFAKAHSLLKSGGLFLFHSFGSVYPAPTLRQPEVRWVESNIFPGFENPSFAQIAKACEGLFAILDVQEFGAYYHPTLIAWRDNFIHGWEKIRHLYDEAFYRKWIYYLSLAAAAFQTPKYQLWQIVLGKDHRTVYEAQR